jgi:hypothetical protein
VKKKNSNNNWERGNQKKSKLSRSKSKCRVINSLNYYNTKEIIIIDSLIIVTYSLTSLAMTPLITSPYQFLLTTKVGDHWSARTSSWSSTARLTFSGNGSSSNGKQGRVGAKELPASLQSTTKELTVADIKRREI